MTHPSPVFDTLENHQETQLPPEAKNAAEFIYSYRGSRATFNAYRREIERLYQWSQHIAQKSITSLKQADIEHYLTFCQSPPNDWIGLKKADRFITRDGARQPNPDWRPFVVTLSKTAHRSGKTAERSDYSLSQKALQSIFAILSSFYNYLIQENSITYNPVSQIRQKSKFIRKTQTKRTIRRLSELQWAYVIETAERMANQDPTHERTLFMMNALFGMYLRISELSASDRWTPTMNDFFRDHDGHWWFRTVGKGNKERHIVVSDSMLSALQRYRLSLNLPKLPDPSDQLPLIPKTRHKGPITSTRHIRTIVQNCFDQAYEQMIQDNLEDDANELNAATVHWLRHTGISEDVKHRPKEHVRDDAGHSSSAITDHYIDVEHRARHQSGKNKIIKPEDL